MPRAHCRSPSTQRAPASPCSFRLSLLLSPGNLTLTQPPTGLGQEVRKGTPIPLPFGDGFVASLNKSLGRSHHCPALRSVLWPDWSAAYLVTCLVFLALFQSSNIVRLRRTAELGAHSPYREPALSRKDTAGLEVSTGVYSPPVVYYTCTYT